jgi:guanylate kinase
MSIIKKIMLYIKNIFIKQDEPKELEKAKVISNENKNEKFLESLKTATIQKKQDKKFEMLICEGDGLGIQKKSTY